MNRFHVVARRFSPIALMLGAALLLHQSGAHAQGAKDPLVGHWELDRGKSDFMPDTTLQSRELLFEAKEGGIRAVQRTVTDRGNTVESEYTAKYDGKDVSITSSALDTVALKKIDGTTVERVGKIAGKQVETATMKISGGGEVLTIATKGSIDGDDYNSNQVFNRQSK